MRIQNILADVKFYIQRKVHDYEEVHRFLKLACNPTVVVNMIDTTSKGESEQTAQLIYKEKCSKCVKKCATKPLKRTVMWD